MSIDNLITLLLFIVFIVVPMLSRAGRKGPQRGKSGTPTKPGQRPQTQGQAQSRGGTQQSNPSTTGLPQQSTSGQPSVPSMSDDFSKRLEEARRRVQEAMEGQSTQGRTPQPPAGQESASDLFRPKPAPQQLSTPNTPIGTPPPSLVTQRPVSQSFLPSESETASGSFQSLSKRKKTGVSKPLQVQRSLGTKRIKLQGRLLTFGETDLMRGIIWKQILDEPRSKQSWRQQSQRR